MEPSDPPLPSTPPGSPSGPWQPPTPEHLQTLLPAYEILAMLGRGGMGAVYKGRQKSLDRLVAVKILPPDLDDTEANYTARFQNEARTMARLNHPGIVGVFEFGKTPEGQLFFVMEYVDGTDVAQMIKAQGHLPPDHALAIAAHVCDALGYAHSHGVIHRDIKPANVLINMQGQVKVADFGLAKQADAGASTALTKTNQAMGTPDFIAPEALILGLTVDHRADLYAVGVMLFQMLSGRVPRGLFQMPGVSSGGAIDPRFDAIITKAMQTEPSQRYQSAAEMRRDLDVILMTPRATREAAAAAVPVRAVEEVPGQRSGVRKPHKPVMKGPQPSGDTPVAAPAPSARRDKSLPAPRKINTGTLVITLGVVTALGIGTFFALNKSANDEMPVVGSGTGKPDEKNAAGPKAPRLSPPAEPWVDGLAEWLADPANPPHLVREEAGARVVAPNAVVLKREEPAEDVAVRLTIRRFTTYCGISLRQEKMDITPYKYIANLKPDGSTKLELMAADKTLDVLAESRAIPGFDPDGSHVFEFSAQGQNLRVSLDGREVASAHDSRRSTGIFYLASKPGALIEKLEYRVLPASTPAVAATGEPWVDALAERNIPAPTRVKNTNAIYAGPGGHRDLAIRATMVEATEVNLVLRASGRNLPDKYMAGLRMRDGRPKAAIQLFHHSSKEAMTLGLAELPAGFKLKARHSTEFLAQGNILALRVDGVEVLRAEDSTLADGTDSFLSAPAGSLLEKLEYRELPPATETAKVPTAQPDGEAKPVDAPEQARPTADPKAAALMAQYANAVTKAAAAASAEDLPAFDAELNRLKNNAPLPDAADDAALPEALKKLRGILRAQLPSTGGTPATPPVRESAAPKG